MDMILVWGTLRVLVLLVKLSVVVALCVEGFAALVVASQLRWRARDKPLRHEQSRLRRLGQAIVCPGWFRWQAGDSHTALARNCTFFVFASFYVVFAVTGHLDVLLKYGFAWLIRGGPVSWPLAWVSVLLPFVYKWLKGAVTESSPKLQPEPAQGPNVESLQPPPQATQMKKPPAQP